MISPCCWIPAALSAAVPGLGARLWRDPGFLTGYGILLFSAGCQIVTQLSKRSNFNMCCSTSSASDSGHMLYLPWWWFAVVGSIVVLRVLVLWSRTRHEKNLVRLAELAK